MLHERLDVISILTVVGIGYAYAREIGADKIQGAIVSLPWTTPLGFSGYLSTGSLKASVFQVFLLILGCFVYYPFIKILDKSYLKDEENQSEEDELEDISFDDLSLDDI